MLPPKKTSPKQQGVQRELLQVYERLSGVDQQSVLAFAQFLAQREGVLPAAPSVPQEPLAIDRPQDESVVHAIRRLAETYPMLNRDEMLHEASNLMSSHVLHGNPAAAVIDKLEALFADTYERYAANQKSNNVS
jgi:hypothetical protein